MSAFLFNYSAPNPQTRNAHLRFMALLAAWLVISIGTLELLGWLTHDNRWVSEKMSWTFIMRFNTALLFFTSGIGLISYLHSKLRVTWACGLMVMMGAGATLSQYLFTIDLGIDEFFVNDYLYRDVGYAGRMSPNAAVALLGTGMALVLMGHDGIKPWRMVAVELVGFMVFALGLTALVGYVTSSEAAYSWGITRMAAPTAIANLALGLSFMMMSWRYQDMSGVKVPLWVPPVLCFGVLLVDITTPYNFVAGIVYVPIVFCSLWYPNPKASFLFAGTATILAVLGYFGGDNAHWMQPVNMANRILNISTLWFIAVLVYLSQLASKKLVRSESRLRAVVDNAVDGLFSTDNHGVIEHFNPACERIFGYPATDVIGQNISELMGADFTMPEGDAVMEVIGRNRNGVMFPVDLSLSTFSFGYDLHYSCIVRDVSKRKQDEAQMRVYMRELERSNQELDDFAYIASHDLKEPLRGLFNHASFLIEDYQEKLDADGVRRLNRLAHLAQRMERLVNDLLYFSRLGRADMAVTETDPNKIINEIKHMSEAYFTERHAEIIVPEPMPRVVCDKTRIAEVFRNLITNAVKYNDKPVRTVEVGFRARMKTAQGIEENVFYVKDNGIGIAHEFHNDIFRIFKRLQQTPANEEEGTGAGLTFVKKIIERHKGRIWLESQAGEGTVFYFTMNAKGKTNERAPEKPGESSLVPHAPRSGSQRATA